MFLEARLIASLAIISYYESTSRILIAVFAANSVSYMSQNIIASRTTADPSPVTVSRYLIECFYLESLGSILLTYPCISDTILSDYRVLGTILENMSPT
jgi:hypothetical protein